MPHFPYTATRPPLIRFALLATFAGTVNAAITFHPHEADNGRENWAFEVGVAFITANNIEDIAGGRINFDKGPAGGQVYRLTAARRLGEFEWKSGDSVFRPQLELPLSLEIVDENGRSPFFDLNGGITVRWVDFPWNRWVSTEFSMGVGLSYSEKVYLIDHQRHADRNRSKWKFDWPIQMTFAHPEHPQHQILLFLAHQSGGHLFDRGGVNSLGLGYRKGF
jgi:hypothetical protein